MMSYIHSTHAFIGLSIAVGLLPPVIYYAPLHKSSERAHIALQAVMAAGLCSIGVLGAVRIHGSSDNYYKRELLPLAGELRAPVYGELKYAEWVNAYRGQFVPHNRPWHLLAANKVKMIRFLHAEKSESCIVAEQMYLPERWPKIGTSFIGWHEERLLTGPSGIEVLVLCRNGLK
jgi:hypothetical protein